jgi:hypothetical protein
MNAMNDGARNSIPSKRKKEKHEPPGASFDQEKYERHKSLIAVLMGNFLLRYLNLLYHEFDGDLLMPVVLGEIAHHNITRFYSREGNCLDINERMAGYVDRMKHLEPGNAYSISEATGVPRETVRRKIDKLIQKGWLVKNARGEVFMSETVSDHFTKDFNKKLLAELLGASECLRELLDPE